jgi:ATPase, YjeE family
MKKRYVIDNLAELPIVANDFIEQAKGKTVFAFLGEMGAGKTTFIKSVCEKLGVEDVINSPTFAIVNAYYSPLLNDSVYHFDLYRIKTTEEALNTGIEEYLESGSLCFIEWPEIVRPILPQAVCWVKITEQENGSRIVELTEST